MTVLACSHGTSSPAGRAAIAGLVDAFAGAHPGLRVEAAFVDVQDPDVPTALAALPSGDPVRVVPLLLSAGFHVYVDLTEAVDEVPGAELAPALGPDPRLAQLLVRRLHEVGLRDDDAVVLAAAGSSDERAVRDCELVATMLAERLGREVVVGYLSAAQPRLADAVAHARSAAAGRVAVATYLLAPGYFADLAAGCGGDVVAAPLLDGGEPPSELLEVLRDRADTLGDASDTHGG